MQSMVTQFARRNGYPDANSSEFDDDLAHPVIDMMEEQKKIKNMECMWESMMVHCIEVILIQI